jgi:hypothetical protein
VFPGKNHSYTVQSGPLLLFQFIFHSQAFVNGSAIYMLQKSRNEIPVGEPRLKHDENTTCLSPPFRPWFAEGTKQGRGPRGY